MTSPLPRETVGCLQSVKRLACQGLRVLHPWCRRQQAEAKVTGKGRTDKFGEKTEIGSAVGRNNDATMTYPLAP